MPRRLSNIEWSTFLHEVNVESLNLPPWGGIVDWRGMKVLTYVGPAPIHEIFLTDVSDATTFISNFPREWNPLSGVWWYHLPAESMGRVVEVVHELPHTLRQILDEAGAAAGGLTKPLLENLYLPLIVLGGLALFLYAPKR